MKLKNNTKYILTISLIVNCLMVGKFFDIEIPPKMDAGRKTL